MEMNSGHELGEHDHFEELCALASTGELTAAEQEELELHLVRCSRCREAFSGYKEFVTAGIPHLAPESAEMASLNPGPRAESESKRELFRRVRAKGISNTSRSVRPHSTERWISAVVVLALLFVVTAIGAYRAGSAKSQGTNTVLASANRSLSSQLQTVIAQKSELDRELQLRSSSLGELSSNLKQRADELVRMKELERTRQAQYDSTVKDEEQTTLALGSLTAERRSLLQQIAEKEKTVQDLEFQLASMKGQRQRDLLRSASFEAEIKDLSARLKDREHAVDQQQQFLASDRDIRELMGARQLYIADVFDVTSDSRTRKPYGRVFYTKGKSLIFYAFDLDRQPQVKEASTFQVWGKNESAQDRPVKLGVLYVDSEANRRWALRCDDPRQLAEIDEVFVTVEPNREINKPTGKPFLYASLRKEPNHP